jgi:hypothetical protein
MFGWDAPDRAERDQVEAKADEGKPGSFDTDSCDAASFDDDELAFLLSCPAIEKAVRDRLNEAAATLTESGVRPRMPFDRPAHLG